MNKRKIFIKLNKETKTKIENDEIINIPSEDIVLQKFMGDEIEKINIALSEAVKEIGSLL